MCRVEEKERDGIGKDHYVCCVCLCVRDRLKAIISLTGGETEVFGIPCM